MGSLRDLRRRIISRTTSIDFFVNLNLLCKRLNVRCDVRQSLEKIFTPYMTSAYLVGPPGSGKTVSALISSFLVIEQLLNKRDPWSHYGLERNSNIYVYFICDNPLYNYANYIKDFCETIIDASPTLRAKHIETPSPYGYTFIPDAKIHLRIDRAGKPINRPHNENIFSIVMDSSRNIEKINENLKISLCCSLDPNFMSPRTVLPNDWLQKNYPQKRDPFPVIVTVDTAMKSLFQCIRK
jgi:hypothetical protein